ncbi:NLRC3 [Symbiodinium sp. CCMP2456]|nr:NLRC3 [Symbiodinium sp. CCMP2456]
MVAVVSLGLLVLLVVAGVILVSNHRPGLHKSSERVVEFSELSGTDVWSDVLSPSAMRQYEQGKKMAAEAYKGADSMVSVANEAASKVHDSVKEGGEKAFTTFQAGAQQAASSVKDAQTKAFNTFQAGAQQAASSVKDAQTKAFNTFQAGAQQAASSVEDAQNQVKEAAKAEKMMEKLGLVGDNAAVAAKDVDSNGLSLGEIQQAVAAAPASIPALAAAATGGTVPPPLTQKPTDAPSESALAPQVSEHDKDPCSNDEEYVGGLCYAKCATLTGGSHPCRSSAWSCCAVEAGPDCWEKAAMESCWVHPGFCFGYAVSGRAEAKQQGSNCPTSLGACLTDEELFMNVCYKKCSAVTSGSHIYRVGAATCCNKQSHFECLWPGNLKTDPTYNMGGGAGDHNSGTPIASHAPLKSLATSE